MDEENPDYRRPDARWEWAGPEWKSHRRDNGIVGLSGAVIQSPDPAGTATLWREVLDLSPSKSNSNAIQLDVGEILFETDSGKDPDFGSFKLQHTDIPGVLARAQNLNLPHDENGVDVAGVRIELEAVTP